PKGIATSCDWRTTRPTTCLMRALSMNEDTTGLAVLMVLIILGLIVVTIFFRFIPIGLWIRAAASGVRVPFMTLFGMRFRKVDPTRIVDPLITAIKAGLPLGINELEAHFLSGGNVARV